MTDTDLLKEILERVKKIEKEIERIKDGVVEDYTSSKPVQPQEVQSGKPVGFDVRC